MGIIRQIKWREYSPKCKTEHCADEVTEEEDCRQRIWRNVPNTTFARNIRSDKPPSDNLKCSNIFMILGESMQNDLEFLQHWKITLK